MVDYSRADDLELLETSGGELAVLSRLADRVGAVSLDQDPGLDEWEAALLVLREVAIGGHVTAELSCPSCGSRAEIRFVIGDLPREPAPEPGAVAGAALRPLRRSDLMALEPIDDPHDRLAELLARAAGRTTTWADETLASPDRDEVVSALDRAAAGLDIQLSTECLECDGQIVAPFDVMPFVHTELTRRARQTLEDVHLIASTYHWSEDEILRLSDRRRQTYVERITGDVLHRELTDAGA